jgi:hypothetical protein
LTEKDRLAGIRVTLMREATMTPDGSGMVLDVQAVSLNGAAPRREQPSGPRPAAGRATFALIGRSWWQLLVTVDLRRQVLPARDVRGGRLTALSDRIGAEDVTW